MIVAAITAALVASALAGEPGQAADRADCKRVEICNGDMCATVCERGTVQVDEWVTEAIAFQRLLQNNVTLLKHEMPGVHNGYQSQATGLGVEEPFMHELFVRANYSDNLVVLANQRYSMTDLLNMGIRHFEIDIWWTPGLEGIRLCHDPAADPRLVFFVNQALGITGTEEPEWDKANLGCYGFSNDDLTTGLRELDAWFQNNPDNLVILYYDTKSVFRPEAVKMAVQPVIDIFGDRVFTPVDKARDFPARWPSLGELFARGKQLIVENNADQFADVPIAAETIFTPTLWSGGGQFGNPDSLADFPECTLSGEPFWGERFVRGLDTSIAKGPAKQQGTQMISPDDLVRFAQCGVFTSALDNVQPDQMENFVWSWARGEPSIPGACVAMREGDGRWVSADCGQSNPLLCESRTDDTDFVVTDEASPRIGAGLATCPAGYAPAVPKTGFTNSIAKTVAAGQRVWLSI